MGSNGSGGRGFGGGVGGLGFGFGSFWLRDLGMQLCFGFASDVLAKLHIYLIDLLNLMIKFRNCLSILEPSLSNCFWLIRLCKLVKIH